jgi:hypothetical protein
MQQWLSPWLQGERPTPKPLNRRTCSYLGHHSSIWLNLLRLSFDWTCITPDVPSRFLWSMQALFMNLVPPSSHFFFNSGPKRTLSLSLDVKCDQQTHKKMMSLIMESWSIPRFDILWTFPECLMCDSWNMVQLTRLWAVLVFPLI